MTVPGNEPAPVDPSTPPVDPQTPNPPPPQETAHLLADLHKEKKARKDLEEKLRLQEMDKLKASERWKEVAEANETRAKEAEERLTARELADQERAKLAAVRESAVRAGIRKEAMNDLKLVDLTGLVVDPNDNVIGADKAIENLKAIRPHWFSNTAKPGINLNQPDVVADTSGKVTYADLQKAEIEAKKTGNYKPYTDLTIRFKNQTA